MPDSTADTNVTKLPCPRPGRKVVMRTALIITHDARTPT